MRRTPTLLPAILLGLAATLGAPAPAAWAQQNKAPKVDKAGKPGDERDDRDDRDDDRRTRTRVFRFGGERGDRAVLGVSTASGAGKRDTLGVFVESVTPGGPGEKAGIEEGDRIASINGVSLRLAPEDAGEPDVGGLMSHRLRREMDKVKAGDAVTLQLWSGGRMRSLKVPTVAADSLPTRFARFDRASMEDRPVLGLNVTTTGSRRDTLGALVTAVATDGPAEKAGIVEGDRIAAINGVDLRVAREDAGDRWASSVKANRFARELRRVKVGDQVELRVVSGGQMRSVRVPAARARDVYKDEASGGMRFYVGDVAEGIAPVPPMPPMPPMPAVAPRVRVAPPMAPLPPEELMLEGGADVDVDLGQLRERLDEVRDQLGDVRVRLRGAPEIVALRETGAGPRGGMFLSGGRGSYGSFRSGRVSATLSGQSGTVSLPGLTLTRVNADLASYFGAGSEGGLLVTRSSGAWSALHEGDVVVSVNGTPVRQGKETRIAMDAAERNELEVIRKGKRVKVEVDGER